MPPSEPDQPEAGNRELKRPGRRSTEDESQGEPHGDYPELPGYGG